MTACSRTPRFFDVQPGSSDECPHHLVDSIGGYGDDGGENNGVHQPPELVSDGEELLEATDDEWGFTDCMAAV